MRATTRAIGLLCAAIAACAAGCAGGGSSPTATLNQSAALVGQLPMNPLAWRVISSAVDPASGTMSTLYGNDMAVDYARTHAQHDYPVGSVVAVVTWTQIEDPRWFGAKIPNQVKSVEFVTVAAGEKGAPQYSYEEYAGNPLTKAAAQPGGAPPERITSLLSSRAAVMP